MERMSSFFLAVLCAIVCQFSVKSDDSCFRLSAAFDYDGSIYLVDGHKFIEVDSNFEEVQNGTMKDEFDGPEGEVDAALVYADDDTLYFFQGNYYYSYYWSSIWGPKANSEWSQFHVGGIDAAGTLGDTSYFFKGCEYREDNGDSPQEGKNVDIGLPCDIDASFGKGDSVYITKGENYWVMDGDKSVSGPHKLSDLLSLNSAICHEEENPFVAKIREEQEYEKENGCVIIDAAVTWKDTVYIFNDDEYIRLDSEGNEDTKDSIYDWGGLPANIDAGIVWSGNGATYFFKGPNYYRYSYVAFGPLGSDLWSPCFEEGIDAAGNHKGMSYFFKRCEINRYVGAKAENEIIKAEDLNLPCDVDGAFSRAGTLYVIKRNQVWTWRADEDEATGPAPLSTVVQLTSWTACAPDDS